MMMLPMAPCCGRVVCPWHILGAAHGDRETAKANADGIARMSSAGTLPPLASFVARHAENWMKGEYMGSCHQQAHHQHQQQYSAWLHSVHRFHSEQTIHIRHSRQSVKSSSSASYAADGRAWYDHAWPSHDHAWPSHGSPQSKDPRYVHTHTWGPAKTKATDQTWDVADSTHDVHSGSGKVWQYFHGKGRQWQTYSEDVQEVIRKAIADRRDAVNVVIDGAEYTLQPKLKQQIRKSTGKVREMRILPTTPQEEPEPMPQH